MKLRLTLASLAFITATALVHADTLVLNGITRIVSKLRGVSDMPDFLPPEAVLDEECFTPGP